MPSLSVSSSHAVNAILRRLSSLKRHHVTCLSNSSGLSCSRKHISTFQSFTGQHGLRSVGVRFAGFSTRRTTVLALRVLHSPGPPATFVCRARVLTTTDLRTVTRTCAAKRLGAKRKRSTNCPGKLPTVIDFRSDFVYRTTCPSVASTRHSTDRCNTGITGLLLGILTNRRIDNGHQVLAPGLIIESDATGPYGSYKV